MVFATMANTKKRKSHLFPAELTTRTIDEYAYMQSEDLLAVLDDLKSLESSFRKGGRDVYWIEVELAHVIRELEIRQLRRDAHELWMKENGEEYYEEFVA